MWLFIPVPVTYHSANLTKNAYLTSLKSLRSARIRTRYSATMPAFSWWRLSSTHSACKLCAMLVRVATDAWRSSSFRPGASHSTGENTDKHMGGRGSHCSVRLVNYIYKGYLMYSIFNLQSNLIIYIHYLNKCRTKIGTISVHRVH